MDRGLITDDIGWNAHPPSERYHFPYSAAGICPSIHLLASIVDF